MQNELMMKSCGNLSGLPRSTQVDANTHYKGGGFGGRYPKCRKFKNLTDGTFFEKARISFDRIFTVMYVWCGGVSHKEAGILAGVTAEHTKVDYFDVFRDVCSQHLAETPGLFQFGGPNALVQVDESVVTERKYNRGWVVPERWVVGIYDTLLARSVIEIVEFRNQQTLTALIQKYVQPGTPTAGLDSMVSELLVSTVMS